MSVIEQETTRTTIEVPLTDVETVLSRMIDEVKAGRWCRDSLRKTTDGRTRRCAIGMAVEFSDRLVIRA